MHSYATLDDVVHVLLHSTGLAAPLTEADRGICRDALRLSLSSALLDTRDIHRLSTVCEERSLNDGQRFALSGALVRLSQTFRKDTVPNGFIAHAVMSNYHAMFMERNYKKLRFLFRTRQRAHNRLCSSLSFASAANLAWAQQVEDDSVHYTLTSRAYRQASKAVRIDVSEGCRNRAHPLLYVMAARAARALGNEYASHKPRHALLLAESVKYWKLANGWDNGSLPSAQDLLAAGATCKQYARLTGDASVAQQAERYYSKAQRRIRLCAHK